MLNQSSYNDVIISFGHVGKMYRLFDKPKDRLKEQLFWRFGKRYSREFWALQDISFEVKKGEALGIIGMNGSGKSTLLQIIAGTLTPTTGEVQVNGRVAALLELGSGFNPEFTGRENVYLNGSILGFSREEMNDRFDQIVAFADIGQFIDQPVKLYSSGMYVRLAFSVLQGIDLDIFIIDEALAVGDIKFSQKCFQYFEEKRKEGKNFVLVSHDMQAILRFCDWVMLLEEGKVIKVGNPIEVVDYYYAKQVGAEFLPKVRRVEAVGREANRIGPNLIETQGPPSYRKNVENFKGLRIGNQKVEIIGFASLDGSGKESSIFLTGDPMALEIYCRANHDVNDLTVTFQVTDRFGTVVFGQNSYMATGKKLSADQGNIIRSRIELPCSFFQGEYLVSIGATICALEFCQEYYDFLEGCLHWVVGQPSWRTFHGIIEIQTNWIFSNADQG